MTAMRCRDQILHVAEVLQQDHSTHTWTVMLDQKKKKKKSPSCLSHYHSEIFAKVAILIINRLQNTGFF